VPQDALSGLSIDQKARAEINELTDTLRGNLDKVVQHGKRADAIVKFFTSSICLSVKGRTSWR
jgi:hypothetical protein